MTNEQDPAGLSSSPDTDALRRAARNEGLWESEAALVEAAADEIDRLRALLSQPEPTADWTCARCGGIASEHAVSSSTCVWEPVPTAEPQTLDHLVRDTDSGNIVWVSPQPPRIEDMAPGTTFEYPERWTVVKNGTADAYARNKQNARFLDEFDPSTIRDVTTPTESTK